MDWLKDNWVLLLICALSAAVAAGRLVTPWRGPSPALTYEALSHVFVGVLIGAWLARGTHGKLCGWAALAISLWELAAFLLGVGKA